MKLFMLVDTAAIAASLLGPYFDGCEGEAVAVLHLDSRHWLLGATFPPPGGAEEVDLPVRDILVAALRMGAGAILIAHNHPSGNPDPSEGDRRATRRLADAACPAGIAVLDHLVFAGGEWRSFRALGLL
jgi:DNA repair protein RadC